MRTVPFARACSVTGHEDGCLQVKSGPSLIDGSFGRASAHFERRESYAKLDSGREEQGVLEHAVNDVKLRIPEVAEAVRPGQPRFRIRRPGQRRDANVDELQVCAHASHVDLESLRSQIHAQCAELRVMQGATALQIGEFSRNEVLDAREVNVVLGCGISHIAGLPRNPPLEREIAHATMDLSG
jgi:hypothetical protein